MTGSGDPRLEVRVLGPVGVVVAEQPLEVGRRMERMLVVRLALARSRVVPDEALARDLWGDEDLGPDRVAERLRVLSHRLRRALGPHGSRRTTWWRWVHARGSDTGRGGGGRGDQPGRRLTPYR